MTKQAIKAPSGLPNVPYSPGMKAGDYIFISGQVGHLDREGNKVEGVEAQTRQTMENMKRVLEMAGASFSDVVKATIFLVNADDFARMNEVYKGYFDKDFPARSTIIVVALARPEILVEIEGIAYQP